MNTGATNMGVTISVFPILLLVGGIVALLVLAFRRRPGVTSGLAIAVVTSLVFLAGGGMLLALMMPAMDAPLDASPSVQVYDTPDAAGTPDVARSPTPTSRPTDQATGQTHYFPPVKVVTTHTNYGVSRRSGIPKIILTAISLMAMLALARVALDGRPGSGYSVAARIVAIAAFVGLCALLAGMGGLI